MWLAHTWRIPGTRYQPFHCKISLHGSTKIIIFCLSINLQTQEILLPPGPCIAECHNLNLPSPVNWPMFWRIQSLQAESVKDTIEMNVILWNVHTLGTSKALRKMLAGLMSLCIIRRPFKYLSALQSWKHQLRISSSGKKRFLIIFSSMRCFRSPPLQLKKINFDCDWI